MLGLVAVCYSASTAVALIVMVVPPRLTYRYDNGYYSCIGHFEGKPDAEPEEGNSDNDNGTGSNEETAAQIARGIGMFLSGLFFLIIILINVLLHHFSKKKLASLQGKSLKKHKTSRYRTLTTHSISALLVLTWLPFATTFFITASRKSGGGVSAECQSNPVIRHVSAFVINFYLLNFVLNPFLYCVTNINFMKFVIKLIKRNCNHYLCVALCSKINPDLDISTNVSTLDQFPGSSNICPITPDRVYSNMLTVPDTSSTKRKATHLKSDSENYNSPFLMEAGRKTRVMITLTDDRRSGTELRNGSSSDIVQIGDVKSHKDSKKVIKSIQLKVLSKCSSKGKTKASKADKTDEKSETIEARALKKLFSKKHQIPRDNATTVPEESIKPVDANKIEIAVA